MTMTLARSLPFIAAFIFTAAPLAAQDRAAASEVMPFANSSAFDYTDGEELYRSSCQACHQANGEGAVGAGAYPALAGNPNLEAAAYPAMLILHGQRGMPALGSYFDDAQVAAVVNYIRTHFGNDFDTPMTAQDVADLR